MAGSNARHGNRRNSCGFEPEVMEAEIYPGSDTYSGQMDLGMLADGVPSRNHAVEMHRLLVKIIETGFFPNYRL